MSSNKTKKKATQANETLEVMDKHNRPLAAFARKDVHRLSLLHRSVFILLYNNRKELYIQQRSTKKQPFPGCWDVSAAGYVQLGESTQEAAQRELMEELGVQIRRPRLVKQIPVSELTGNEFIYLYSTGQCAQKPKPDPAEIQNGLFVQKNELAYLVKTCSELLTPALLLFWRLEMLFPDLKQS